MTEGTRGKASKGPAEPILILHVEDDPAHAELVRRGFEGHRLANEIRHVASGQAALDYLLRSGHWASPESSPRPDVVLLDLRLPGMDGLEVLERIRATPELESLPVVVLTTSEADGDRLKSYENRIDGYVVKPLGFDSFAILLDVIDLVIRKRLGGLPRGESRLQQPPATAVPLASGSKSTRPEE